MASAAFAPVVRYLHRTAAAHADHLTDSDLLDRFAERQDEAAFATLVHRHSRLVLGVCRRIVRDWHAAEDCFQAVFLVLATKAHTLRRTESLGPWLHAVAHRIARKARSQACTRSRHEQNAVTDDAFEAVDELVWRDLRPMLDDAIASLQEKYRIPFILCYLQGRTVSDIARDLGQPKGTVAAWLARAREQLRGRLVRRGVTPLGAGLTLALSKSTATAAVPPALAFGTIKSAVLVAAGRAAVAASIPTRTAALMEGAIRSMFLAKMKTVLAVLGVVGIGTALLGYQSMAAATQQVPEKQQSKAGATVNEPARPLATVPVAEELRYDLQYEIVELNRDGSEKLIASPKVRALDKMETTVEIPMSNVELDGVAVPTGIRCSATVYSTTEGRIDLVLHVERFAKIVAGKYETRTTGTNWRLNKITKPGDKIEFDLAGIGTDEKKTRVRVATSRLRMISVPYDESSTPAKPSK